MAEEIIIEITSEVEFVEAGEQSFACVKLFMDEKELDTIIVEVPLG